jgi:hypothetical protein
LRFGAREWHWRGVRLKGLVIVAESWSSDLVGAQAEGVNVYQSAIKATYTSNGIVDLNGEECDLGAPKVATARLIVTTLTGTTPKLDAKLQSRPTADDDWVDVTDGAFTQAAAADEQVLAVVLHRFVRVVSNFTDTITVCVMSVELIVNN